MSFDFRTESLFPKLLARSFIFFTLILCLHMTDNDPLNFSTCVSVLNRKSGSSILRFNLLGEGSLRVTEIKLVGMSGSVHHKLLRLVVISLRYDICNDVSVFWKQSFVVDFFPFELLPELSVAVQGLIHCAHSRESEILQV